MERMKEHGWYLTEQGFNIVSDNGSINDISKLTKRALDLDLREIGSGEGDITQGNLILQIQKLRNVAAPKNNEESHAAPRMLKLYLSDGKNNYQAVEVENIPSISLNTSPGTKILLKSGVVAMSHGIILLRPSNIACVLGGKVPNLIEKWELNRKLASHTRVRLSDEGGPPPWIPFGKKIIRVTDNKQFKALAEKNNAGKDNSEFEAQRQDAIAEAARQGSKKVFGGGNKQLLDHTVQRIVEQGFTIEQAEYALKVNRNNVDRALKSLQRNDNKHNTREPREPREPRGKRFEKKSEETKPSSGKVSLFDFFEDKLPTKPEPVEITTQYNNSENFGNSRFDNQTERNEYRGVDGSSNKGGRIQKGGRGSYQAPPRHSDDSKFSKRNNENHNTTQYGNHSASNNSNQGKPPRFQRNQDSHHQQEQNFRGSHGKSTQSNDRNRNTFGNSRGSFHNNANDQTGNYSKNTRNQSDSNNRHYNQFDGEANNRHINDNSHLKSNRPHHSETNSTKSYTNIADRNHNDNQLNRYQTNNLDVNVPIRFNSNRSGDVSSVGHKNLNDYNNSNRNSANELTNGLWVWKKGDQCMAKYWEDNKYYNAEVTAVSTRTCVVQFKDFNNYEEVLQADCIPITEDITQNFSSAPDDHRRQEHRSGYRSQRHDQGYNVTGNMEFRRGGGGSSGGTRGFNKKRAQQRSAQPIYQPPAQRR